VLLTFDLLEIQAISLSPPLALQAVKSRREKERECAGPLDVPAHTPKWIFFLYSLIAANSRGAKGTRPFGQLPV
jgi:hypothetical protein